MIVLSRFILVFFVLPAVAQTPYKDSLNKYLTDYIAKHEVVTGTDKQYMEFFPIDPQYRVMATFEKTSGAQWFQMETSGMIKKTFRVFGLLHFSINDTPVTLSLYQSQNLMNIKEYQDHLFLPFTDLSSGRETYASGRYIDLTLADIVNNRVVIDFNKAYNPYCVYVSGKYNCPIPPRENQLQVAILAGEKNFAKSAH